MMITCIAPYAHNSYAVEGSDTTGVQQHSRCRHPKKMAVK